MWDLFFFDVIFTGCILFLPGFLFCRALNVSRVLSLAFAPVWFALCSYLLSYCFMVVGIQVSWSTIVVPLFLLGLLIYLIRYAVVKERGSFLRKIDYRLVGIFLLYIVIAIVLLMLYYVRPLDGAGSFAQEYDNYSHLSTVRQFIESGVYALPNPLSYPASWYNIAAIVSSFDGGELCVAINAVNFVIVGIVFPSSIFSFLCVLFNRRVSILLCGSLCSMAFTAFPWGLIVFGPLYPNLFAYSVLPAVMSFLIVGLKGCSPLHFVLFFFGAIALIFMHPNAIFAGIVIMTPYVVSWIWHFEFSGEKSTSLNKKTSKAFISILFVAFVVIIWSVLNGAEILKTVVNFNWPAYLPKLQAVANAFVLNLTPNSMPQYLLSALVFMGIVRCVAKRNNMWLIAAYVVSLIILVVAQSTEGPLKHYLAGFWYTDRYRIAAMVAILGIPLASLGLLGLIGAIRNLLEKTLVVRRETAIYTGSCALAVMVALYFPSFYISEFDIHETPFGKMSNLMAERNSLGEEAVYSQEEVAFVDKVIATIPQNSKVANIPFDGTFLAYGVNGINTAYRALETAGYWDGVSDPQGELIRKNLCNYTSDPETYNAVKDSGIQYVILLDKDDKNWERMYPCAKEPAFWEGISNIEDNTPGFEVVLSEGDMRLYQLTAL